MSHSTSNPGVEFIDYSTTAGGYEGYRPSLGVIAFLPHHSRKFLTKLIDKHKSQ
ncbi:MAG: hypothetical protein SAqTSB_36290 [Shewanella algae]